MPTTQLSVTKAVLPVAGLGTRFLPATKASPKEMLCVVDKPLIQYAVEEAYEAGIRQMIFVTGRNKRSIEDHFDYSQELEAELITSEKNELLEIVRKVAPSDMQCVYIRQPKALGLGHAVLCAEKLIGSEPFAVLLPDELYTGRPNVTQQLIDCHAEHHVSMIAVLDVAPELTHKYGVVLGQSYSVSLLRIESMVEKPKPGTSPSNTVIAGRYILSPTIFDFLRTLGSGASGEIQLTDGIAQLLKHEAVYGLRYTAERYDCGSKLGFLQANVALALAHTEIGSEFKQWLKEL